MKHARSANRFTMPGRRRAPQIARPRRSTWWRSEFQCAELGQHTQYALCWVLRQMLDLFHRQPESGRWSTVLGASGQVMVRNRRR
ncbi:hypothetical protein KCP73_14540 [Salmonella enterica subsp. enterica]|nr:hypothetical protein KCP73_14540 [Salmonella enterica subsp. enterica]